MRREPAIRVIVADDHPLFRAAIREAMAAGRDGATFLEARMCSRQEVVIVGGGNSAGQAAVFLAARLSKVADCLEHYGATPVGHLQRLGLLKGNTVADHAVAGHRHSFYERNTIQCRTTST